MNQNYYELRKFTVPEFIFGVNAHLLAPQYIKNYDASKVLVVTDPGVIKAGWVSPVVQRLEDENIDYTIFSNVSSNPRDFQVMEGAGIYNAEDCDAIIAIGGGSPMDLAKGVGIVVTNGGNILEYEGIDQVPVPMPPLVCIPTTGGTAADVSQFAIINNTAEKVKIAIVSKSVIADIALIDPQTLCTMNPYLSACTGLDALVHAVEAYVSNASAPITDLHALSAIKLIVENLQKTITEPNNIEFRGNMMLASLQAGMAFSNASLGLVHAMAHSLGGYLDLPHGECNALLLSHVINFNFESQIHKFSKIAGIFGINTENISGRELKSALCTKIKEFRTNLGIIDGLKTRGVTSSDITSLAEKAISDPCVVTNPRQPLLQDIEVIYEEAL